MILSAKALVRPLRPRRTRRGGFSLLEVLVASGLMALLVSLVLSVTFTAVEAWNRATSTLTAVQQARAALDLLQADLETALFRDDGTVAWLAYDEQSIEGVTGAEPSGYLRFVGRPLDRSADEEGAVNALAYQVVVVNPLRSEASEGRLPALYRGRLGARATLLEGGLDKLSDAAAGTYGIPDITTYVTGGVAGFTVRFGVSVRDAEGQVYPYIVQTREPLSREEGVGYDVREQIRFPLEDFVASELGTATRIVAPDWVEVTMVLLPEDALRLLEAANAGLADGPQSSWSAIVERYGTRFTRRVALPVAGR